MILRKISRKKQTIWRVFFSNLDFIIAISNGIILIPIYLIFIDSSLYGAWLATGAILSWLSISDPGVGLILQQKVSKYYSQNNRKKIGNVLYSAFLISIISTLFIISIGYVFEINLGNIINIEKNNIDLIILKKAFRFSVIGLLFTIIGYFVGDTLMGLQRSKEAGLFRTLSLISGLVLKIVFLYSDYNLVSIPLANTIGSLIYLILSLLLLIKILLEEKIKLNFNKAYFLNFIKIFYFTFASKTTLSVKKNIDLLIIARVIGTEMVTVFELSKRPITIIFNYLKIPAVAMLAPLANVKGDEHKEKYSNIIFLSTLLLLSTSSVFLFLFLIFNQHILYLWVGEEFFIGYYENIGLSLFFFLSTILSVFALFTFSLGNIIENSKVEIFRDVLCILFLVFLGNYFGIWGIISAFLLSSLISEGIYFPLKLFSLIEISKNKIIIILKTLLINIFVGLIFIFSFNYFDFNLTNWFNLLFAGLVSGIVMLSIPILIYSEIRKNLIIIINEIFKTHK